MRRTLQDKGRKNLLFARVLEEMEQTATTFCSHPGPD